MCIVTQVQGAELTGVVITLAQQGLEGLHDPSCSPPLLYSLESIPEHSEHLFHQFYQ